MGHLPAISARDFKVTAAATVITEVTTAPDVSTCHLQTALKVRGSRSSKGQRMQMSRQAMPLLCWVLTIGCRGVLHADQLAVTCTDQCFLIFRVLLGT